MKFHTSIEEMTMARRFLARAVLVAVLAMPTYVGAHEGHAHKVMGTVSAYHENHLEVKATDGKVTTITLNEKTKIVRGKTNAMAADIKPGQRVVVTATETKGTDGKTAMIASEVQLAALVATK
jgi:hypothetical protein